MKKSGYDDLEVSKRLSAVVSDAIETGFRREEKTKRILKRFKIAVLSFLFLFLIPLNTIPVYAKTLSQIPIVKNIAQIFTFREYHFEDDIKYIDAKIPKFSYKGKSDLEKRVNQEINKIINEEIENAENNAKEYYKAFIETGGDKKDFIPVKIKVDYEIKCMTDSIASFIISKSESFANAYNNDYFYNIDLKTGKYFTLRDLIGDDYKKVVAEKIRSIISGWDNEQKGLLFDNINLEDLINDNTNFYINSANEIVVVFEKYEVAAGAAGKLEFPIMKVK